MLSFEFQYHIDLELVKGVGQSGTFIFGFLIFLQKLIGVHPHVHNLLVNQGELRDRNVLYGRDGFDTNSALKQRLATTEPTDHLTENRKYTNARQ